MLIRVVDCGCAKSRAINSKPLKVSLHFNKLEDLLRVDIERLAGILGVANSERMPRNTYLGFDVSVS
jgi:hypothetical protein